MPVTDSDPGWASWLQQFLPQIGAPQPGNILNSPAAGPSLGRLGVPTAMGGQGLYTPPGGQQPGPPMQIGMPQGAMDPSIAAHTAMQQSSSPWTNDPNNAGGIPPWWRGGGTSPAAPSTAAPGSGQVGGIGSDARFPLTSAGAPMSGAPPNTSPSGGGIGSDYVASARTAPGRPAPVASPAAAVPPGPLSSRFAMIDRPNAPAGGAAQGRGGAPMMSALDLSGMFNRGQPAGAIPANATAQVPPNPNNPYWGPNPAGRAAFGGPIMPNDITGYPVAGVNAPTPAMSVPGRGNIAGPGAGGEYAAGDPRNLAQLFPWLTAKNNDYRKWQ